jgi:hypothetical protein
MTGGCCWGNWAASCGGKDWEEGVGAARCGGRDWEEGVGAGLGGLDEGWENVRILRNFLSQFS